MRFFDHLTIYRRGFWLEGVLTGGVFHLDIYISFLVKDVTLAKQQNHCYLVFVWCSVNITLFSVFVMGWWSPPPSRYLPLLIWNNNNTYQYFITELNKLRTFGSSPTNEYVATLNSYRSNWSPCAHHMFLVRRHYRPLQQAEVKYCNKIWNMYYCCVILKGANELERKCPGAKWPQPLYLNGFLSYTQSNLPYGNTVIHQILIILINI